MSNPLLWQVRAVHILDHGANSFSTCPGALKVCQRSRYRRVPARCRQVSAEQSLVSSLSEGFDKLRYSSNDDILGFWVRRDIPHLAKPRDLCRSILFPEARNPRNPVQWVAYERRMLGPSLGMKPSPSMRTPKPRGNEDLETTTAGQGRSDAFRGGDWVDPQQPRRLLPPFTGAD